MEWNNIEGRSKRNFAKHQHQEDGYPYDNESVMHYGDHAYSKNGKLTLKVLQGKQILGQRQGLSKMDQALLNAHYCKNKSNNGELEIVLERGLKTVKEQEKENERKVEALTKGLQLSRQKQKESMRKEFELEKKLIKIEQVKETEKVEEKLAMGSKEKEKLVEKVGQLSGYLEQWILKMTQG